MKYKDLIQFESLDEVVKFNRLEDPDYRKQTVSSYVFSQTYEKTIIPEICRNLDYTSSEETFGLQILGTYGTGKSHLMSLISLIAEDADYLPLVKSDKARQVLANIAGKYKIVRFEMGATNALWNLVAFQIDKQFKEWGINYSLLDDQTSDMYKDKLSRMLAHFEEKFPDKGLIVVIDEMLSYLKGRANGAALNQDLAVLQALGEKCDHSKFRFVYGVQEQVYSAPEFQFAANMLNQVGQRYRTIEITKQDVQFVTEQRILHKDEAQKQQVRQHLEQFVQFFPDMHAKMDEYVNLFPVHPAFFDNFQRIKIAKSQREILKTLSRKFKEIAEQEVPSDQPGLISYDSYWSDLQASALQTYADIRRVTEIMQTINQKIDENFTGGRAKNAALAHRIASLCAVRVLQDSLEKTNGANAETIADDLCYVNAGAIDRDFLIDTIGSVAGQIVKATVGQYFEQNNTNQEYHLRVEGGINIEQTIKDFAQTIPDDTKDSYFFNYLVEHLPIETDPYRKAFSIYAHRINWNSHKVMLDGYIFMGNPDQRSTTQPERFFYIYFMPIFNLKNIQQTDDADSVFFRMENVSEEMKQMLTLYGAANAMMGRVDTSQQPMYKVYVDRYEKELRTIFDEQFKTATEVYYMGEKQTISPAMMNGGSKEEVVSNIASALLEDYFCGKLPYYPEFKMLKSALTNDNRPAILKGARQKIANPTQPNSNGEAILLGLGLMKEDRLSTEASIYAQKVLQDLEAKGEGQVLNRDEILYKYYADWSDDYRSREFDIPADLEFLVLATMVAQGEIEISIQGGKTITATNLRDIVDLPKEAFYSFSHIRKPKGINLAAVRELFVGITGKDLSGQLQNPEVFGELVSCAKQLAQRAVTAQHTLLSGLKINNISLIDSGKAQDIKNALSALTGLADRVQTFNTKAKISNLSAEWTAEELHRVLQSQQYIHQINTLSKLAREMEPQYNYLEQALNYIPEGNSLRQDISDLIRRFEAIEPEDVGAQKIATLRSDFTAFCGKYADWYMAEYNRMHISANDNIEKNRIMASEWRTVCEKVCRADQQYGYFSVATQYRKWEEEMAQLVPAEPSVTRDYLLRTPYARFNPAAFAGKELPKIGELKEKLQDLYIYVDNAVKQILNDAEMQAKKEMLPAALQSLYARFLGGEELSAKNAEELVQLVVELHKNVHSVPVTIDDLRQQVFNRPMTPTEAIKAFRNYIQSLPDGDDVRIIFKN